MSETRWLPLESNPDVMNKYISNLGVPSSWSLIDVYGLDAELLSMVPKPVAAVLLLYPLTTKSESQPIGTENQNPNVYFIKQTIGNACGTIGLIHAICNNADAIGLTKHLAKFFENTKDKKPEEKAKLLENDVAFGDAHEETAQDGQTQAPDRDERINLHFVAFVHKDGNLYELDGRKDAPLLHGKTTADTLLEDTADVVKKFMARDPAELSFTLVALVKSA